MPALCLCAVHRPSVGVAKLARAQVNARWEKASQHWPAPLIRIGITDLILPNHMLISKLLKRKFSASFLIM
jgi:hypothetical protein